MIDANPRAVEGGNNPPLDPYAANVIHMDGLLTEARNWADGTKVETQAQADDLSRLIDDLRKAEKASTQARDEEKAPHQTIVDEIQERWNVWLAPTKNKKPGKVPMAIEALKSTLEAFLIAEKRRKDAEAEVARKAAQEAADAAAEAMCLASPDNLQDREAAEAKLEAAREAERLANHAEKDKAHAHGGDRAMGLRTSWKPELMDGRAALVHYLKERPDDVRALLQALAERDVREGKRSIPGFNVVELQKL